MTNGFTGTEKRRLPNILTLRIRSIYIALFTDIKLTMTIKTRILEPYSNRIKIKIKKHK